MADPFELQRFLDAQDHDGTLALAVQELRAGRKSSHWVWYVFPQLAGLGRSPKAQQYAISGLPEARAYLEHPGLGPRLVSCATILLDLPDGTDIVTVMGGGLDAAKLRSSMTLFAQASAAVERRESVFDAVLDRFFAGGRDPATLALLADAGR